MDETEVAESEEAEEVEGAEVVEVEAEVDDVVVGAVDVDAVAPSPATKVSPS